MITESIDLLADFVNKTTKAIHFITGECMGHIGIA
jgi:hypothetical protein